MSETQRKDQEVMCRMDDVKRGGIKEIGGERFHGLWNTLVLAVAKDILLSHISQDGVVPVPQEVLSEAEGIVQLFIKTLRKYR